ncbi:uncharacterized protein LOC144139227 [Haemaphysalis longicornis]
MRNFSGFAIINTPLRESRLAMISKEFRLIFRQHKHGAPALHPSWIYMHTASIYLPLGSASEDENVRDIYGDADIVGISTHNSTDEPNSLLFSCDPYCVHKRASPPNPIHPAHPHVRGMLDIVREIPRWKKVLGKTRMCVSVTSAINFATSKAAEIDFVHDIGGLPEAVQRYTRRRFMSKSRDRRNPPFPTYPVDTWNTVYHWDNTTRTHFWSNYSDAGKLLTFFAYDKADSLGPKVKDLLNAYPDDRCLVFDDLGDDSFKGTIKTRTGEITFDSFELLKAIAAQMTAKYGPAFPPEYY